MFYPLDWIQIHKTKNQIPNFVLLTFRLFQKCIKKVIEFSFTPTKKYYYFNISNLVDISPIQWNKNLLKIIL